MARKRTGTLIGPKVRNGKLTYLAQVTVTENGKTSRPLYSLETDDPALARRKLRRLVKSLEGGNVSTDVAAKQAGTPETFGEYRKPWFEAREKQGIVSAKDEKRWLEYAADELDGMSLGDVRPAHIRSVLALALDDGYSRQSLVHLRGALFRLFDTAWRDEVIAENPVDRTKVPPVREKKKERVVLTDAEIFTYLESSHVDAEVRVMACCSRILGGMRTGDLNAWSWEAIDTSEFVECTIPRQKTRHERPPQSLIIPEPMRPILSRWWQDHNRPASGPVFPVRRGERAGEFKSAENSYAKRLKRDLRRSGVIRHECLWHPPMAPPKAGKPCCDNFKLDPLYCETATSLPVDFHSFRRAFASALAEAGVNVQRAQILTGHTDAKVHMRYVARSTEMRSIPDAALPALPSIATTVCVSSVDSSKTGTPEGTRTPDPRLRSRTDVSEEATKQGSIGDPAALTVTKKPLDSYSIRTQSQQSQRHAFEASFSFRSLMAMTNLAGFVAANRVSLEGIFA